MKLIRRIQKYGIYVLIIGLIVIGLLTRDITYMISYLIGTIASNVSFAINYTNVNNIGKIEGVSKHSNGFLLRMLVYAIALSVVILTFGDIASLFALVGCLTIKHAILIQSFVDRRLNKDEFL